MVPHEPADVPDRQRSAWAAEVRSALATLEPLQRRLLTLTYLRSRSEQEIVADTGLSAATVRSVVAEGLRRLAEALLS